MHEKPLVEFQNISMIYHTLSGETHAVDRVSFDVHDGEFVSIVGPSGCGKSTLLSMAAGLLKPSDGSVKVLGREVECPTSDVGYMLQKDHLFGWRTIRQNVLLGLEVQKKLTPENIDKAERLLDTYGLAEFADHYPHQLSGGMRQRVALIRTLAINPSILLLDEAFSALDYQTRLAVSDEISGIIRNEKKTAVLVTHDISEAISMADRVVVLSKRPARLKEIYDIRLTASSESPIERRKAPEFKEYFNQIWKELDVHVA
jgi:NitT/TauT family transport system ATP-binding protein